MLTATRITHFNIYYTQKITQSNSPCEKVARKTLDRSSSVLKFFDFFLRMRKQKTKFFVKMPWNFLKARFALCHTYSFLPDRSESKTCQEQVSHRLPKMNFCPSAPCWGLRTPIPRGSISSHSFAEKSAKVFFENDYGTDDLSVPSFFAFQTCKCQEFLTGEPAVGLVYIESEWSLW